MRPVKTAAMTVPGHVQQRVVQHLDQENGREPGHGETGDILHTYVELNRPAEWVAGIDFTDAAAAAARVAAEFDGWAPELTALITEADTRPVPRMIYGAELAEAIAAHPGDTEAALAAYEAALFPRSAAEYADAHEIIDLCLGDRAPYGLIEFMTGAAAS